MIIILHTDGIYDSATDTNWQTFFKTFNLGLVNVAVPHNTFLSLISPQCALQVE